MLFRSREIASNVEANIVVKPSYGLTEEQMLDMLKSGFGSAESDKQARALAEVKVEAQSLILAIQAALNQDSHLLSDSESKAIETQLNALVQLNQGQDGDAIRHATEALNAATEDFAAKRMDASVSRALAGKNLENLNL